MKKIIKMTETDLTRLVRMVLKEEGYNISEYDDEINEEEFIREEEKEGGEEKSSEKSTPTVKKWQGQRGWENVTRGKGNPISSKSVWQSGITRGPGNPV
jgi:hypothetical protein